MAMAAIGQRGGQEVHARLCESQVLRARCTVAQILGRQVRWRLIQLLSQLIKWPGAAKQLVLPVLVKDCARMALGLCACSLVDRVNGYLLLMTCAGGEAVGY